MGNFILQKSKTVLIRLTDDNLDENGKILFEGYLKTESLNLKSFRKRWIVLKNDNKVYSYKSQSDTSNDTQTEIIDLKKIV